MSAPTGGDPMTSSHTVAMVSGNDLLSRLDASTERLTRIEVAVTGIPGQIQHLADKAEANASRIDALERWRAMVGGVSAVVVLLLTSGVAAAILTAVHHG